MAQIKAGRAEFLLPPFIFAPLFPSGEIECWVSHPSRFRIAPDLCAQALASMRPDLARMLIEGMPLTDISGS